MTTLFKHPENGSVASSSERCQFRPLVPWDVSEASLRGSSEPWQKQM